MDRLKGDGMFSLQRCPHYLLDKIYSERTIPLEDGGTTPLNVYIPREEGDLLYSMVRHNRPKLTVEVGMANGLSTLFIAAALRENGTGTHIAIDPFQHSEWRGVGAQLIRQAGMSDIVRLIEKPSYQGLPQLEQEGARVELVFIDGAHIFDYVIADFLCADRILDVGGVMIFDDSDWPAVQPAIRYILANRHYRVARPDVIIEPPRVRPSISSRALRAIGRRVPAIGNRLRPDFMNPSEQIGTLGRCVVLEKMANDDRDSQDRSVHQRF